MASCGDGAIFWTLSLEFQFYLLVSLLVFFVSRKWLMIILFLALIFQMAIPHNHWQNLLSFLRTDAFICGVMIAFIKIYCPDLYCRAEPRFLRWRAVGIIVTGVMGAGLILSGNHEYFPWEYRTQSVTLFAACLVWYASYNKNYIACFDRVRPALLWLGSRSYALYLSHPFVWGVVWWYFREMKPCLPEAIYFIGLLIVGLGVLFLIAELNYRLIEVWLRKQGVMYCARRKPGFA
jgi:peptidoglycan/LPS O-acetylase OafA/YrhL